MELIGFQLFYLIEWNSLIIQCFYSFKVEFIGCNCFTAVRWKSLVYLILLVKCLVFLLCNMFDCSGGIVGHPRCPTKHAPTRSVHLARFRSLLIVLFLGVARHVPPGQPSLGAMLPRLSLFTPRQVFERGVIVIGVITSISNISIVAMRTLACASRII